MNKVKEKKTKIFKGVVVSDKMDKTRVILVGRIKTNLKYKKQYKISKKYKVHDEKNSTNIGDRVEFIACRPISKDKRWRIINRKTKEIQSSRKNLDN